MFYTSLKKAFKLTLFSFCFSLHLFSKISADRAVTYETTNTRFGDNLLSFIHAKWISYQYQLPLVYRPFINADKLMLSENYPHFSDFYFKSTINLDFNRISEDLSKKNTLFIVPYFPESIYERTCCYNDKQEPWQYFDINWEDQLFIEELLKDIKPKHRIQLVPTPKNRISLAVHIRNGGRFDDLVTRKDFPLKFLSEKFYIDQIKKIYTLLNHSPLYVYVFTDRARPKATIRRLMRQFSNEDIIFDSRPSHVSDVTNIDDFFSMMQFDCLIHSESNFSRIPALITDYAISIYPNTFVEREGSFFYENPVIKVNEDKIKQIKARIGQ